MDDNRKFSEQEQQRRLISIDEFCQRYCLGRTRTYEEIKSGRLRGRKVGKRTVISLDDAENWLARLPFIEAAQ